MDLFYQGGTMNENVKEIAKIVIKELDKNTDGTFYTEEIATALHEAGYRKQSETVKEFAEKLKKELFVNCVIIQTVYNSQKEDMDSFEAFQIIDELAEQYGKEVEE